MKKNTKQSGMIRLDTLASFLLIVTLSSIVLTFASINYFREARESQNKSHSAPIMSLSSLSADLGAFKHLIVNGPTELNGDVFIQGEKLDLASLKGNSYTNDSPKLIAGDGITIDGLTITNNAPNAIQNTFEKIKVSNNEIDTLFGASNGDDTLTFVAGGNINIASDTTNKKLTISGTATGWLLSGSNVHLSDSTYNVGIGTTTPAALLDVRNTDSISIITNSVLQTQGLTDTALGATTTVTGGTLSNGGPTYRGNDARWIVTATGQQMKVDLGASISNLYAIAFGTDYRTDSRFPPKGYTIEYSTDDASYTTLVTVTDNTSTSVVHTTDIAARYIRITVDAFQDGQSQSNIAGLQILTANFSALAGQNIWAIRPTFDNQSVFLNTTGNVGIGTTAPTTKLQVVGTFSASGQGTFTHAPTQAHTGTWAVGSSTWYASDASIYINPSSAVADSNLLGLAVGDSVKFSIDAEGDIYARNLILTGTTSTGTTDVVGDLTVEGNTTLGDASSDTITFNSATHTYTNDTNLILSGGINGLSFDTDTLSIDATNNYVGIGTTTPGAKLDVNGGATFAGDIKQSWSSWKNYVQYPDTYTSSPTYAMGWSTDATNRVLYIDNLIGESPSGVKNSIQFRNGNGSLTTKMIIDSSGYVGIGTSAPDSLLEVAGKVNLAVATTGQATLSVDTNNAPTTGASTIATTLDLYNDTSVNLSGHTGDAHGVRLQALNFAATGTPTIPNAAQLYIASAPTISAGGTITNAYSLWIDAGDTRLDGSLAFNGTAINDSAGDIVGVSKIAFSSLDANSAQRIFSSTDLNIQYDANGFAIINASSVDTLTVNANGQVAIPVTGSSAGITIGGDTQLYRSAADTLTLGSGDVLTTAVDNQSAITLGTSAGSGSVGLTMATGSKSYFWNIPGTSHTAANLLQLVAGSYAAGLAGSPIITIEGDVGRVNFPTTGSGAGIVIGGDTQLYRSAADTLAVASGDSLNIVNGNLQFGTTNKSIIDANSNEFITFTVGSATAINEFTIANAATGGGPAIKTTGGDTNINLYAQPKGTGGFIVSDQSANPWFVVNGLASAANYITVTPTVTLGSPAINAVGSDTNVSLQLFAKGTSGVINLGNNGGTTLATLNASGQFQIPTTGSSAGLLIGGDANLYRSAADVLSTDDSFSITNRLTAGTQSILDYVYNRFEGSYTSGGGSTVAVGQLYDGAITGASGDTNYLTGSMFSNTFTTQAAADTIGTIAQMRVLEPDITIGTATVTNAVTLYIDNAPTEGSNNYALWVDSGAVRFDAALTVGTGITATTGNIQATTGKFTTSASGQSVGLELNGFVDAGSFNNYILNNSPSAGTYATLNFGRTTGLLFGFIRSNNNTQALELGTAATTRLSIDTNGQVALSTTGSTGGLLIGGDTQLYRSAANQLALATGDNLILTGSSSGDTLIQGQVSGDAATRFLIDTGGSIYWGAGSGSRDTNLYRSAANTLKTDDAFVVGSTLSVGGNITPSSATVLTTTLTTVVDAATNTGYDSEIFCVATDDCKIVYRDATNADIMMVDCDNETCSTNTVTTVDSVTSASLADPSIYCISSTDCKIAYRDATNQNLMMADCDNSTCSSKTLTTVDGGAGGGETPSIYCVSATDCKIAYFDNLNADLMMADCDDATCATNTITQVDNTSANIGQYPSIYCISSTDCKISYYDATNTNLIMADCDNATCSTKTLTTVDSTTSAATGTWTSIDCVSATDCKIAYVDGINTNLMMADCDDATCSTKTLTTVDSTTSANTGQYASIHCLATDDCKIAHQDATNQDLVMVDCDDATCATKTLTTVDSTTSADTGDFASIYCVSSTDCKISYIDDTASPDNLMMADCDSTDCTEGVSGYNLGSSVLPFESIYAGSYYGKNTTISSFDLAEEYYSTDALEAGDIVSVYTGEGGRDDQVSRTTEEYEQGAIGIVSTEPGITLANWQQRDRTGMYPIALAGRVPVKVSTENGPIQAGDAITSSSIPGVGMRATKAGRIVGTALGSYNGTGIGSVIIFVNPSYFLGTAIAQNVSDDPLFSILDSVGILNTQYQGQILSSEQVQKLIGEQATVLGISTEQTSSVSAQLASLADSVGALETNLTAQETAIASIAATLANLPVINLTQFATGSAVLGITIVEEDFAVTGNTTLSNLSTIGNITVANNLTLGATAINTIGEDLQIQPLKQGNVSFMDGLVTVDILGNIKLVGNVHADSITLTKDKTVGYSTIPAGDISVTIATTALEANSQIFVTPITPTHNKIMYISDKQYGESFTVSIDGDASTEEIGFGWLIVGAKEN